MRSIIILVISCFLIIGMLLGALNVDIIHYNLGFIQFDCPKGAALLGAMGLGWLLGGCTAYLGLAWRHRKSHETKTSRASETSTHP